MNVFNSFQSVTVTVALIQCSIDSAFTIKTIFFYVINDIINEYSYSKKKKNKKTKKLMK